MDRLLIFDIGLHKGYDSEFYLKKGFRVVALEAAPALCEQSSKRLAHWISSGRLQIVSRALSERDNEQVAFYLNPEKDDWGSIFRGAAEKGVGAAIQIEVKTITLSTLFNTFGVPYYLKCDIEGADSLLVRQLLADGRRPVHVSIEANEPADFDLLAACGYTSAQLVNQWMHPFVVCPNPSREGQFVQASFNGETSGLFGRELDPDKWVSLPEAKRRFDNWKSLRLLDERLAPGWVDVHVRCDANL